MCVHIMKETIYSKEDFLIKVYSLYNQKSWRIRDLKRFFPFIKYNSIAKKVYRYKKQGLLKYIPMSRYRITNKGIGKLEYYETL